MTFSDVLFLALVLLTFADLASTISALDLGAKEANSFLRNLFGELGVDAVLFPAKWAVIGGVGYYREGMDWRILAALVLVYAVVVSNNLRWLRKHR